MASQYFDAFFGDIALQVGSLDTERGRDIAVQSPAYGDKHSLFDRGLRVNRTTVDVRLADKPGWAPYLDRYDALVRAAESGRVAIFSHPIDGSYRARCADITARANADELSVTVTCVFLREDPPQVSYDVGAGVTTFAGPEVVSVAAAKVDEELADLGLASTAPADSLAAVESWSEAGDELDSQQVYLEVATLTDRIDTAIADLQLTTDLSRWQAYEAMIRLRHALRSAAVAFTSESASVFDLYIEVSRPVIAICADVYGAELAVERADQVTHLNRLRTPALVPRGTTLKMPAVGA